MKQRIILSYICGVITGIALALAVLMAQGKTFDEKVSDKLTGGTVSTKSMALWELYQYQYTTLLRKSPMCYCPWQAYMAVQRYVSIDGWDFNYKFRITTNLKKLLRDDAVYNRDFARRFKVSGTKKQQVRKIWKWCCSVNYNTDRNTTRDAFQWHTSACAGISGAFYVLCRVKKIPVRYVIGWTDGGCHAWNRVKLSGQWYWIDCTFRYWLSDEQYIGRKVMEIW